MDENNTFKNPDAGYIEINEWDKFQHYKKRNPPWVKLYTAVLDDDDFDCLPDDSKLLFFCLLAFASRRKNKMRLNLKWLQKKLPVDKIITMETLQPLIDAEFISCYQSDSTVIASRKQSATPETKPKTETETESETKKEMENCVNIDIGIDKENQHFMSQLSTIFRPNPKEAITFARIAEFFVSRVRSGRLEVGIFNQAVGWAQDASRSTAINKKGLFVAKVKKETGFVGKGRYL